MVALLQLIAIIGLGNIKSELAEDIESYEHEGNFSKVHALEWEWQDAFATQRDLARAYMGHGVRSL